VENIEKLLDDLNLCRLDYGQDETPVSPPRKRFKMNGSRSIVEFFTLSEVVVVNITLLAALVIYSYKYLRKKLKE
jgi:hypothetical protein